MPIGIIIVLTFCEHIIDKSNRKQIQLGHRKTELFASQEKQRSSHRSVSRAMFFTAFFMLFASIIPSVGLFFFNRRAYYTISTNSLAIILTDSFFCDIIGLNN